MKIEGNRPALDTDALRRTDQPATPAAKTQRGGTDAAAKPTDRVLVSDDAKQVQGLIANAVNAARALPDIRPEAVARGRAKLESGELGADASTLADAIINDLLK